MVLNRGDIFWIEEERLVIDFSIEWSDCFIL